MTFAAFLVIALSQLTPMGLAETRIAMPFPTMEACEVYMKLAKNEVKSASSFHLAGGEISCVPAASLEAPAEPKKDPKEKQV